jgi:hypothetical protein
LTVLANRHFVAQLDRNRCQLALKAFCTILKTLSDYAGRKTIKLPINFSRESVIRPTARFSTQFLTLFFALSVAANLAAQTAPTPIGRAQEQSAETSAGAMLLNVTDTTASSLESERDTSASPTGVQGDLPDDPAPQKTADERRAPQTKRIMGIIPNFRAVSTDEILPAQTVKEKFVTTMQDSFDYSSIVIPSVLAGYSMATDATPEFHQGMAGYGRYFWHSAVDQTTENLFVQFAFPVLTHEDSRYYTLGRGGVFRRTGYSLSRAVVTRSDSAKSVFNISEVFGAGASAGLSSLYYPTRERSFSNTAQGWGLNVGVDAITFMLKEFWPDVNQGLFHAAKTVDGAKQ